MTRQNIITWILLLFLTLLAGLFSRSSITYLLPIILLLAILKFMGVAFAFMEMQESNLFWKVLILGYLIIFSGAILVLHYQ